MLRGGVTAGWSKGDWSTETSFFVGPDREDRKHPPRGAKNPSRAALVHSEGGRGRHATPDQGPESTCSGALVRVRRNRSAVRPLGGKRSFGTATGLNLHSFCHLLNTNLWDAEDCEARPPAWAAGGRLSC
jgi:hypothetical protein